MLYLPGYIDRYIIELQHEDLEYYNTHIRKNEWINTLRRLLYSNQTILPCLTISRTNNTTDAEWRL